MDTQPIGNGSNAVSQKQKAKQKMVARIAKLVRAEGLGYDDWRYVSRRVRQKCDLHPAKKPKKLPRVLTADEFRRFYLVVDRAEDVQHALMLRLIFYTGVRVGELCRIEVADVDLEACKIFVNQGKGSKDRYVLFGKGFATALRTHIAAHSANRWLFQTRRNGKFMPRRVASIEVAGTPLHLVGSPDFMLPTPEGWRIRDAKLAQNIDHPEIIAQLNFYGLLHEHVQGGPAALEVVLGTGQIVPVPYLGREQVICQIQELLRVVTNDGAYEPVGWSKCAGCGYRGICWPMAMKRQDVAILLDVDQSLARLLHERGCRTITDLLRDYDLDTLADITRPWGARVQRVGRRAATSILNHARAMVENRVVVRATPCLPDASNLVMFDLEGLPPHVDQKERVFLWGLKVFGDRPSPFQYSCAFPGQADDETAWFAFLHLAGRLFEDYGDIPFVHWAAYESSKLNLYLKRYGDRDGIAARVRANLLDLLRIMAKLVCLPLPTRSLKEVEKFVGFQRQLPGSGDWAVSQYIRAAEIGDHNLLNEILAYNQEDLDATWTVYEWLKTAK